MATKTKNVKKLAAGSRLGWRAWLTVTDLVAVVCGVWVVVGAWQETHSVGECAVRFAIVYAGVHLCAPMVRRKR